MNSQDIKKITLPDTSGVYFFLGVRDPKSKDRTGKILYIGKATSLRNRVRSYFTGDISKSRGGTIVKMLEEARTVKYEKTDSVLEALILEANLIKKHQPKYNAKEKSDKSFNYVVITDEDFPRVLIMRGRELLGSRSTKWGMWYKIGLKPRLKRGSPEHTAMQYVLGPFPQGNVLRDALKIVRKIFPFRDKCLPCRSLTSTVASHQISDQSISGCKPCFNRQIGLCPGVCSGDVTKTEYRKIISNLKMFFCGKKKMLVKKLKKEMILAAKKQEFEKASKLKKTIFSLGHIQDVALIKQNLRQGLSLPGGFRIEGYDVAHISGTSTVGVMVVIEDGEAQTDEYRKFKIKTVVGANDTASLAEILERRFAHPEWQYPRLIVVDGGKAQKNMAERVLKNLGIKIPVVSVVKDKRHRPREILGLKKFRIDHEKEILLTNNESHRFAVKYHRNVRGML